MSVAWRNPAADGVKVTVTLQLEDAARIAPQVLLEIRKSPAFVPEMAILLIAIVEVPRLVNMMELGVPEDPRATLCHTRLFGVIRTPATRQPVRKLRKRLAVRSKPFAEFRRLVLDCFTSSVLVTSSGFILLTGKAQSPRMTAMKQRKQNQNPATIVITFLH